MLQNKFDWNGISIDINKETVKQFSKERKRKAICADATQINYYKLLAENNFPKEIDYLQIDCDPEHISYEILTKIPFNEYKFAVITFEHDYYLKKSDIREKSREFLKSKGYKLVVPNVSYNKESPFEDWWIHPDLVDSDIFERMRNNKEINFVEDYFFNIIEEMDIDYLLSNNYVNEEQVKLENENSLKKFGATRKAIHSEFTNTFANFIRGYIDFKNWIEKYRDFTSNQIRGDGDSHKECLYFLDLVKNIQENGITEPVRIKVENDKFTIKDGSHRMLIAKVLGHKKIKCVKE